MRSFERGRVMGMGNLLDRLAGRARALPRRSALAMSRRTGLPPGFWCVLGWSALAGAVAAVVVVAAVFNLGQRPRRLPQESVEATQISESRLQ